MKTKILIAYQHDPGIYHPYIGRFLIPCVLIGETYHLCEALATKDREALVLDVVFSNKEEVHKGYIEMHKTSQDANKVSYNVVGLNNYKGEQEWILEKYHNPSIFLRFFKEACKTPVPEYIYFKVVQTIKKHIPLDYNKGFLRSCECLE